MKSLLIFLLAIISSSISYSQSDYIDRSWGDNGTVVFEDIEIRENIYPIVVDSLDNMYVSHSKYDSVGRFHYYSHTKLDKNGQKIFEDQLMIESDSLVRLNIDNDVFLFFSHLAGSTFVHTFDLDMNPLGRFILPEELTSATLEAQPDGSIFGHTVSTIFSFNVEGSLDQEFSGDGLFNITDYDFFDGSLPYQIYEAIRTTDNAIMVSGFYTDTEDNAIGFTLRLDEYGILDTTYGNGGFSEVDIEGEDYIYILPYRMDEAQDGDLLVQLVLLDDIVLQYTLVKIDPLDGSVKSNFGINSLVEGFYNPTDSTTYNDYNFYIGQMPDGSLLHSSLIYDEVAQPDRFLNLHNEEGIQEPNFGMSLS